MAVTVMLILMVREQRTIRSVEERVNDQLHAMHEAMLLWEFGARNEAIELLAEHDIFVVE